MKLSVQPVGAGLMLGLLPGGSELTELARIRGRRTIFTDASTLGQLFPGAVLNYRIPWRGRPTPGTYHVLGTIRPQGAAVIDINRTIRFTAARAKQLNRETPTADTQVISGTPGWVWIALAAAAALLIALPVAVWKLARRPRDHIAG